MIAKMAKGRGFRGALEYDLQDGKSELLETNLSGETVRAMAQEFGAVRQLRPTLGKAVVHVAVSVPPGEHVTDDQWRAIGHRYLEAMGFEDNQYVITRHTDTDHEHIHILANRITFAGEVVSDSQDWKRQEALMRVLEREYGLTPVAPSAEAERRAPTKGEIEAVVRTGQPSLKHQLQDLCDAAMQECRSLSDYIERLEAVGVDVIPTVQLQGAKVSGLMYRLDDTLMKGSDLGKAYSPVGLAKKGVTYEQNRDFATVERCRKREAHREFAATTRDLAPDAGTERGRVSGPAGAVGASDGRVDGRDPGDLSAVTAREYGAGTGVRRPESGVTAPVGTESGRTARSGPAADASDRPVDSKFGPDSAPSDVAAGVETLRRDRGDGAVGRAAHHRIVDLALGQASADYPALEAVRDRTVQAVQRQLQAFGVDRLDLGIRDGQQGKMMQRLWTPEEVAQNVPWLKRMNAQGNDIYVRPAGEHGLVLVDDLTPDAVDRLKGQGFDPAIVTETSPGNLQAWLKLSRESVDPALRQRFAKDVAEDFGGDLNSADGQHYGRLAGFTNRKPNRLLETGRFPYVLLREGSGQVMAQAEGVLAQLEIRQEQEARREEIRSWEAPLGWPTRAKRPPLDEYRQQAQVLQARYSDPDWSKLDWMIATRMAGSGHYTLQEITQALAEGSPNLATRKPGHLEDYARRTAEKAWQAPTAQAQRSLNRARQEDRGYSR